MEKTARLAGGGPQPRGVDSTPGYRWLVPIRVVYAEDNYLVRAGTAALLGEAVDVEVVAAVADLDALLAAVAAYRPDAVLTDIRMPPTNTDEGLVAARRIRAEHPGVGVVVLSQYIEDQYAIDLLRDGVDGLGYLLKERVAEVDEVVAALRTVAAGGSAIDPKVVERLVRRRAGAESPLADLTPRELGVLGEMARGRSNAAIAAALHLSERSVEKGIAAVFTKLGLVEQPDANRRVLAVLTFLEAG
jgi:DNA-binding NarL/FixJ family response regulator